MCIVKAAHLFSDCHDHAMPFLTPRKFSQNMINIMVLREEKINAALLSHSKKARSYLLKGTTPGSAPWPRPLAMSLCEQRMTGTSTAEVDAMLMDAAQLVLLHEGAIALD